VTPRVVLALLLAMGCGGDERRRSTGAGGGGESEGAGVGGEDPGYEPGLGGMPDNPTQVETGAGLGSDEPPPAAPGKAPTKAPDQSTGVQAPADRAEEGAAPPPRPAMNSDARGEYEQGLRALQSGDLAAARTAFAEALEEDPRAFKAVFGLGIVAERQGNDADAQTQYNQTLRIQPDYERAVVASANLMTRRGQLGQALEFVRAYAERYPRNLDIQVKYADVLIQNRRHEDAIRIAKGALRRDERHVGSMIVLAKANYHLGRYELAQQILDQAKTVDATVAELHLLLGFVHLGRDARGSAIAAFEEAVRVRPDYAEAHNNLGVLYLRGSNYDRAIAEFEAAQRVSPNWISVYLNLGDAYRGAKKYEKAKAVLEQALRMNGQYADAHFNMGVLLLQADSMPGQDKLDQLQAAIREFGRYKELMASRLGRDDPADRYIEEANRAITREKTRRDREAARKAAEAQRGQAREGEGEAEEVVEE